MLLRFSAKSMDSVVGIHSNNIYCIHNRTFVPLILQILYPCKIAHLNACFDIKCFLKLPYTFAQLVVVWSGAGTSRRHIWSGGGSQERSSTQQSQRGHRSLSRWTGKAVGTANRQKGMYARHNIMILRG